MGIAPEESAFTAPISKELSLAGQAASAWFRLLARALKSARLYRSDNPIVEQLHAQVADVLTENLRKFGTWKLAFTWNEIRLGEEAVVHPARRRPGSDPTGAVAPEEKLPFAFFRDGIRTMTLPTSVPRSEIDTLFESLRVAGASASRDDLATLLWQANLAHIQIETVPPEQTIYLYSKKGRKDPVAPTRGLAYALAPTGSEIRADLGQAAGSQGLHRDTF